MDIHPLSAMFIVCGAHITENLQHHKSKDVERILEDKGFAKSAGNPDNCVYFFKQEGNAAGGKRTVIIFGDQDFVLPEHGVRFYDAPDALKE